MEKCWRCYTSICDGIIYALFGSFSRYLHEKATKLAIGENDFKKCVGATFSAKLGLLRAILGPAWDI